MRVLTSVLLGSLLSVNPAIASGYHHVIVPTVVKGNSSGSNGVVSSGSSFNFGAVFVIGVATIIIVHELLGPACASRDAKHGYNNPALWRPLCKHNAPSNGYFKGK